MSELQHGYNITEHRSGSAIILYVSKDGNGHYIGSHSDRPEADSAVALYQEAARQADAMGCKR
jgi:hypothetical protein